MKTKNIRLPIHVAPERYELILKPDLEGFTFDGEETISLSLEKDTKQITLHSVELEILTADFIHKNKEVWVGKISYDEKAETATLTFPKLLEKGKGQLKFKFKGILNDKMKGFYRSLYEVNGQKKHMATTQFESTDARRAFPCFDEPAKKAIFDVTLMIPGNTTAISNTIESEVLEHESGYKVVKFLPTPKMSTYLLAFIVGEFEYIEAKTKKGVLVRIFVTPGKKHQAQFALDTSVKCLEFYEDYFKISYPLPALDLIAIPDFAAGAMENWGAVTYRETAILVDPEYSSTANKQWVALVIAHELAHQWFGNLVTMEWWTHLWLNEGFASYIEYLAVDYLFPDWDIWTQFVYLDLGAALKLDGLKNTHPIEVEVHHPNEISEIFDAVSYSKGASVIRMLAGYLGESNFRDGLRYYLKKHAYANASTEDLWAAFEKVSGKPIRKMMKNWTSKPGYPVLALKESSNKLNLSQSRFFSSINSKKSSNDKTIWSIPLRLESNPANKREIMLMDKKSINITKPGNDSWIKINPGEVSMIRADYPAKYLHLLKKPLKDNKLEAPDRLGLIRDAFALSESGQLATHQALELTLSYKDETDYTVWMEITSSLRDLSNLLSGENFYDDFRAFGREVYTQITNKLGWEKKSDEKHTDTLLRSISLYNLGTYGDEKTMQKAWQLFKGLTSGKSKLEADLRGVVYGLISENGSNKEYSQIKIMYSEATLQEEKVRLVRALGMFKNRILLQKTLELSLSKNVRSQDTFVILNTVWANPKGRDLAWEFVKDNWIELRRRYAGGHIFPKVIKGADNFISGKDAKDIERFFKKNPTPELSRTIAQVLEKIYSNDSWLKRDKEKIAEFLKKP